MENSVWIVYQSDWSGISLYFDELSAYKAAVKEHAEVVQVGEGDIKDQAKNPREFNTVTNQSNQENINANRDPSNPKRENSPPKKDGLTPEQIEARRRVANTGVQEINFTRAK